MHKPNQEALLDLTRKIVDKHDAQLESHKVEIELLLRSKELFVFIGENVSIALKELVNQDTELKNRIEPLENRLRVIEEATMTLAKLVERLVTVMEKKNGLD